jgi:hypothetical protein
MGNAWSRLRNTAIQGGADVIEAITRDVDASTTISPPENSGNIDLEWTAAATTLIEHIDDHILYDEPLECSTFTCFPKLPAEIRLLIWTWACYIPRVVFITPEQVGSLFNHLDEEEGCFRFRSLEPQPAVLHASQESRGTAKKIYNFGFSNIVSQGSSKFFAPGRIYVNWEVDILLPVRQWSEEARSSFCCYHPKIRNMGWEVPIEDPEAGLDVLTGFEDWKRLRIESICLFFPSMFDDTYPQAYRKPKTADDAEKDPLTMVAERLDRIFGEREEHLIQLRLRHAEQREKFLREGGQEDDFIPEEEYLDERLGSSPWHRPNIIIYRRPGWEDWLREYKEWLSKKGQNL